MLAKLSGVSSMKQMVHLVFNILLFVGGLFLIVKGHQEISLKNLAVMLLGLSMLITLLYRYNQKFLA